MGMKLDQIEARLQALIENSVALFARGDAQRRLAHQLIAAAQENIVIEADHRAIAPNLYTIYLHPDSLDYWQEHGRLLDAIGHSLMEAAREYDVFFHNEPILRLVADAKLPLEGIKVTAAEQHEASGHTAAFSAVPTTPQQNSIPQNAFVIVEGNRIFPLNRIVINIGRRPDNHLVLSDPRVSRAHAQIRAIRGQYVIFDLNSTGGTLVNGRRINQCALKPGDVISLSGVPLIYGEDAPLGGEDTQEYGFTRSMNNPSKNEPPEIIE
jgi:hypothetical protein